MHPTLLRFIETRSRIATIRRVLFFAVLGIFLLSSVALGGMTRHPRVPPPSGTLHLESGLVPVPSASRSPDATAPPPAAHDAGPLPVYEAIDFVEEQGDVFALSYDHLSALALNPQRTVCVLEYTLYQALVEGQNLEPLYRDIRKRRIERLEASSLANGATLTLPVVPLVSLPRSHAGAFENRAWGHSLPAPLVPLMAAGDGAPVITRVRVVLPSPYHFGKSGEYVRDED
jgi:hypothetical protein